MADFSIRYSQAVVRASGIEDTLRVGWLVDDVLGLLDDHAANLRIRVLTLYARYGPLGLVGPFADPADDAHVGSCVAQLDKQAFAWKQDGVPQAVLEAATIATEGRIDPWLAPHLSRIVFSRGTGVDTVPDLLAGTAWAISRAVSMGPYRVVQCQHCALPWFTAGQGKYCQRPAPDSASQTCQDVGKMHDFRKRQKGESARESFDRVIQAAKEIDQQERENPNG